MKFMRPAFLLATLAICASAGDVAGKWKAAFLGPKEKCPKTFCEVVLNFKVDGDKVTGVAQMGNWPGDAPISDGKIDGDRISFTTIGKLWSSSGFPKMKFAGTLNGGEMRLTMSWGWLDNDQAVPRIMEWQCKKVLE
jgi:hypothetical protein